jgi:hypothetical protein
VDREALLELIESLDTKSHDLSGALGFLRSVVATTPTKSAAQLEGRPDVQEALQVISDWVADAHKAAQTLETLAPQGAGRLVAEQVDKTLDGFTHDTSLDRIDEWRDDDTPVDTWAARIILRMQWLKEWLRAQVDWLGLGTAYKRWVSRLDASTCKYCRGLHGTVLPVGASFLTAAAQLGYTRTYGGLFAPPLHPRCRCRLEGVTQAEYDRGADT